MLGSGAAPEGLKPLGIFDNATLLKMWCEVTPRLIFPARRIGRLENGFEASFLVLDGNPLTDFGNVRKINMRVRRGMILPDMAPSEP